MHLKYEKSKRRDGETMQAKPNKPDQLELNYKRVALGMSDIISTKLDLLFSFRRVSVENKIYSVFSKLSSQILMINLLNYKSRGALLIVEPVVLQRLTDKMLGGSGNGQSSTFEDFSDSEVFFNQQLVDWFTQEYSKADIEVDYIRSERELQKIHFFFPDEDVQVVTLSAYINNEYAGQMIACHPKD